MQRMHIVTVQFSETIGVGEQIQSAYDDDFIMPDGSWVLVNAARGLVDFAVVLDDIPFEQELENLKQGLSDHVSCTWEIISVGPEEAYRDLDPCFN